MTKLIERALSAITARTNLYTGLTHRNDKNAAKEMFNLLHAAGEILLSSEISSWAQMNGWSDKDAEELGVLAQQIGMGKKVRIDNAPWWKPDILKIIMIDDEKDKKVVTVDTDIPHS